MPGSIDEFSVAQQYGSRLGDTNQITDNDNLLMKQLLGILGLDVDRDGKLIRRKYVVDGIEYSSKPAMSYEGAVKLLHEFLPPYMSNLGSYTNLSESKALTIVESFNVNLAYWMWGNREKFNIEPSECKVLIDTISDQVYLQLQRSTGKENMIVQVMGNTQKQYVYRGDADAMQHDAYNKPERRGWLNIGGLFGR